MHRGDIYLKRFGNREKVKNYWKDICNETITEKLIMKLIRLTKVMDYTGLARSTIYKYIAEGTFPRPVSLGSRAAAWVESEVQDWILTRIEERDAQSGTV